MQVPLLYHEAYLLRYHWARAANFWYKVCMKLLMYSAWLEGMLKQFRIHRLLALSTPEICYFVDRLSKQHLQIVHTATFILVEHLNLSLMNFGEAPWFKLHLATTTYPSAVISLTTLFRRSRTSLQSLWSLSCVMEFSFLILFPPVLVFSLCNLEYWAVPAQRFLPTDEGHQPESPWLLSFPTRTRIVCHCCRNVVMFCCYQTPKFSFQVFYLPKNMRGFRLFEWIFIVPLLSFFGSVA